MPLARLEKDIIALRNFKIVTHTNWNNQCGKQTNEVTLGNDKVVDH
jgi:hypothetical protein